MNLPIIIDIEASGFGKNGYPIEVGIIVENAETWCSLITPEADWQHWDDTAESAHHIKREFLFTHGKSASEIAHQLNERLHNKTVYSDGWMHDFVWISRLFDAANIAPHFKLEDLRNVLTLEQQAAWHETKDQVLKELNETRHRASVDAKIIQATWIRTRSNQSVE